MNREWFQEDPFLEISRLTLILGVSHITKSLRPWWFRTTPWLARLCRSSSHGLVPKMGVRSRDDSGWLCNGENYDRTWDTAGIDGFWSFGVFFSVVFRQALHARKLEELLLNFCTGDWGCAGHHRLQPCCRFYAYGFTEAKVLAKKMAGAFGILSMSNWKSPSLIWFALNDERKN